MTTNGVLTNGATRHDGEHLTEDQLNRYLDGDLTPDERREADLHLAVCDVCAVLLSELSAISSLLASLPELRAPRSFQLDASHARKPASFWQRFGAALLPALPAMRAGTIALALAFASVTAYRIADDGPETGPIPEENVVQVVATNTVQAGPTATAPADGAGEETDALPTETAMIFMAPDDEADRADDQSQPKVQPTDAGGATGGSAELAPPSDADEAAPREGAESEPAGDVAEGDAAEESTTMMVTADEPEAPEATAESAEADPASFEIAQSVPEASPMIEATPTATVQPTATQTATAEPVVPTPTPTEVPAPVVEEHSDDDSWLGWAQLVLGVLMVLLGGLVVGVQRLRRKVTG